MRLFQELIHCRCKYGIEKAMEEYLVSLFMFDVLYVDGKDLTYSLFPLSERCLRKSFKKAKE